MDSLWVLLPAAQRASGEWIDDVLRARAAEKGLLDRSPRAGEFPRQRVELIRDSDPVAAVNRLYRERGWTDGLPIVPPTIGRVDEMVAAGPLPRHVSIGDVEPLGGVASVEKIAVNAVMAGCEPEHFSVVLAAVQALLDPTFNLRGVQTTDENVAPLLIVTGPIAARLGINAGWGALGPGWHANAAIGRAVRFVMHNIGGGWPGAVSFAGLAQAGRYTLCIGERGDTPWPTLHSELGWREDQSAVTLLRAETVINVTGGLEEIASVMGSAASLFGILHSGVPTVILSPFTARRLAGDGMTRADVRRLLWERGRLPVETWRRSWIHATVRATDWPGWVRAAESDGAIPAVREPDDITLLVAGADVHVPQHAYCPSWGHPPCRVTREVAEP